MFFDAQILTAPPQILVPEGENPHLVELAFQALATIPVGPEQAIPFPIGRIRTGLNKEVVKHLIEALTEVHEKMGDPPRQSDITVAHNMQQAEQVAKGIIVP